jgi:CheY-like chemotaxis protein
MRAHSALTLSPRYEASLSVSDGPLSALPSPLIKPQQRVDPPLVPSKPLEVESPRPAPPLAAGPASPANVAPFLIVDDNYVNLKLLSSYLSRKSYPFTTAVDGVFAVEAYKATRGNFSCVFMDIQMPRMDGIAATRAIREYERIEKLQPVTVVALTGLVTDEKQREAEASGVNAFFAKPVRLKELDGILERTAKPMGSISNEKGSE